MLKRETDAGDDDDDGVQWDDEETPTQHSAVPHDASSPDMSDRLIAVSSSTTTGGGDSVAMETTPSEPVPRATGFKLWWMRFGATLVKRRHSASRDRKAVSGGGRGDTSRDLTLVDVNGFIDLTCIGLT